MLCAVLAAGAVTVRLDPGVVGHDEVLCFFIYVLEDRDGGVSSVDSGISAELPHWSVRSYMASSVPISEPLEKKIREREAEW